jgi:hypothetical protein
MKVKYRVKAMTENKIIGDDGELLQPDTTSAYYEVAENVVQPPVAAPVPRRSPMSIVFGVLVIGVIIVLTSLCNELNSRAATSYSTLTLDDIARQAPTIEALSTIRAATLQAQATP